MIVDEAHERSVASDMLLGLLRKVCRRRPELRVIVASATINADRFRRLFERNTKEPPARRDRAQDTATIVSVAGRQHAVSTHYLEVRRLLSPIASFCDATMHVSRDATMRVASEEGPPFDTDEP